MKNVFSNSFLAKNEKKKGKKMIKQSIDGLTGKTLDIEISDGDFADLKALMAGEIAIFGESASGGTPLPATPVPLNSQSYYVSRNDVKGTKEGVSVSIPHVKESVGWAQVMTQMKGKFHCGYDSTNKCENVKLLFDQKK